MKLIQDKTEASNEVEELDILDSIDFDNNGYELGNYDQFQNNETYSDPGDLTLNTIVTLSSDMIHDSFIFLYLCRIPIKGIKRFKMNYSENQLRRFVHRNNDYPKVENFRYCLFRLLKKMIRKIQGNDLYNFKIKLNTENMEQVKALNIMKEICLLFKRKVKRFSDNVRGPQTEGRRYKHRYRADTNFMKHSNQYNFKTYNNECIVNMFKDPIKRGLYKAFIDYLFQSGPKKLMEIFSFKCCQLGLEDCCIEKWKDLKMFSMTTLINCKYISPS
jgi:hypothetical protein